MTHGQALESAIGGRNDKRRVVLLEHAPGKLIGYTIALLKAAALSDPSIRNACEIDCFALAAEDYPLEANNNTLNRKDNALLCTIAHRGVAVVGFSVFSWNLVYFSRLSKILKLMTPNVKIIWGGKIATNDYNRLSSENPQVDCFCIGEGEHVFQDYLLHVLDSESCSAPLPGTFMRIGNEYRLGRPGRLPKLGSLPNPYLEGLIDSKMISQAYVETLRGCVYSCTFCDWGGKFYRTYDDDFICRVILKCLQLRFDVIFFMDSIFAVQPDRRKRFLQTIIENHNGHSTFGFELFVEHLDQESIDLLRTISRMGALSKLEIGLQSTHLPTLKIIKRPHKPDKFRKRYFDLIRGAPDLQDRVQIDLIIGLPGETRETYGSGINVVFGLDPGIISTFPMDVFPGGEMHLQQVDDYALIHLDTPPYSIVSTSTMTAFEIQELMSLSWAFVTMRQIIRRSLFYLHHICGENIFGFMNDFAGWCVAKRRLSSWFDYEKIEVHLVNLAEYICSDAFEQKKLDHSCFNRLKQLLAFELAPLMCVHGRYQDFAGIISTDQPTWSARNDRSQDAEANLTAFYFDDLILFNSHPETHGAVVGAEGNTALLLVETNDGCFRKWQIDTGDLSILRDAIPSDRMFLAGNTTLPEAFNHCLLSANTA